MADMAANIVTGNTVTVKMAGMDVVNDSSRLKTILGSCVGIILHDPDRRVSGLAHIMLPAKHRDDGTAGKYADTAIPELLARLTGSGSRRSSPGAFRQDPPPERGLSPHALPLWKPPFSILLPRSPV